MNDKIVERHIPCEECGSSDAKCIWEDGHGYCFACNHFFPSTEKEFETNIMEEFTYEYLSWRGISKESFAFYDVKTKISNEGRPIAIGFKYPNGSYKVRLLDKKEFYIEKSPGGETPNKGGLFGRNCFSAGAHKYITITEGELDACSLYQVLKSPVVSVSSATSAGNDVSIDRSWLNDYERIYLAFDNDTAGREAVARVAKLFDFNKIYVVKFIKYKDANGYVQNGNIEELRNIWWNAKKYLPETIRSSFEDFKIILNQPKKIGVPYPFPTLTQMTYGIRTGESVLLTALEGVGKTEIMHAIQYKILKETEANVGAIYLEEPKERHLQAIAGLELQRPAHLPDTGCSTDEIYNALEQVLRQDDRLHLYSHFGSDDPEILADTIRFLVSVRNCRYIFFDHITASVSALAGDDERRALDYLSTRLEMMVKELDFALLFVSHVNDENRTRGSRLMSKIADMRIDAKRDLLAEDPIERRTTYLTIAKNRFCGRTGPAGKLLFDPITYSLSEIGDAANDNGVLPWIKVA